LRARAIALHNTNDAQARNTCYVCDYVSPVGSLIASTSPSAIGLPILAVALHIIRVAHQINNRVIPSWHIIAIGLTNV